MLLSSSWLICTQTKNSSQLCTLLECRQHQQFAALRIALGFQGWMATKERVPPALRLARDFGGCAVVTLPVCLNRVDVNVIPVVGPASVAPRPAAVFARVRPYSSMTCPLHAASAAATDAIVPKRCEERKTSRHLVVPSCGIHWDRAGRYSTMIAGLALRPTPWLE